MKPFLCKECKWNKNGWCYKYECNGNDKIELCDKYKEDTVSSIKKSDIDSFLKFLKQHKEMLYDIKLHTSGIYGKKLDISIEIERISKFESYLRDLKQRI